VEAEEIAELVLSQVRRIASARADALPRLAIGRDAKDGARALLSCGGGLGRDVDAIARTAAIARDEIEPVIVAAKDRVRGVISTRRERRADAYRVLELAFPRPVAAIDLDAIAADRVEVITVDEEPLRAARAEPLRDHLEAIEEPIAIIVREPPDGLSIADEEPPFAVEGDVVRSAAKLGARRAIHPKAGRKLHAILDELERELGCASGRAGENDANGGEREAKAGEATSAHGFSPFPRVRG